MRLQAVAFTLVVSFALCAGSGEARRNGLRPTANPSAVIATELAYSRAAQEKGQWTAFRDYAAVDAIMFTPQTVKAKDWLKGRANPAQAVLWEPFAVWMSCDGSLAVTKGEWHRPGGKVGYFNTAWRRQKDGTYKWEFDGGDTLAEPLAKPEMIQGQVSDCSRASAPEIPPAPAGVDQRMAWSDDKTLQWIVQVKPDGSRDFRVHRWNGTGYEEALRSEVAAG
ncbi:MAG: hypothetical protein ACXWI1_08560 [Croceibacterium sp.]